MIAACLSTLRSRSALALVAGALLFGLLLAGPAHAISAVILNSDDDSLSVIDTATYRETSRSYIGRAPHHLMPTPDGKTLILAMAGGNELVFIDRASGNIRNRLPASDPYQIGFSPDAKWFVATSLRLDRIDIYEAANYQLKYRLPAPTTPSHMDFSPDSRTVYISLQGSGAMMAIDLASGKPVWNTPVGRQPAGVLVRPSGTILVANMGSDHFAEISPQDGSVIQRVRTGRGAHNFLLSPDRQTLYVSNRVAGTISLLDPATLAITGTFVAPGGPDDMAISADGKELWVTGRWRASVNVLDRSTGALKATIPVGRSPHGIFVY